MDNQALILLSYFQSCTSGKLGALECGPLWQMLVIAVLLVVALLLLLILRLRSRMRSDGAVTSDK